MTILEFVEKYNNLNSDKAKDQMLRSHIKRTYCPIIEKRVVLDQMLDGAIIVNDYGLKHIDLVTSRINYTMSLIVLYTDLTVDFDDKGNALKFKDYDILVENNMINKICEFIGEREIKELGDVNAGLIATFENSESSLSSIALKFIHSFANELSSNLSNLAEISYDVADV